MPLRIFTRTFQPKVGRLIRMFSLDRKNNILIRKKEYKYSRSFRNEIKKTEAKDQFLLQTGVFLENEV